MFRFSCDFQDQFSNDHCYWLWFDTAQLDGERASNLLAKASRISETKIMADEAIPELDLAVGTRVLLYHPDIDFEVEAVLHFGPRLAHGHSGSVLVSSGWYVEPDWSSIRDC